MVANRVLSTPDAERELKEGDLDCAVVVDWMGGWSHLVCKDETVAQTILRNVPGTQRAKTIPNGNPTLLIKRVDFEAVLEKLYPL